MPRGSRRRSPPRSAGPPPLLPPLSIALSRQGQGPWAPLFAPQQERSRSRSRSQPRNVPESLRPLVRRPRVRSSSSAAAVPASKRARKSRFDAAVVSKSVTAGSAAAPKSKEALLALIKAKKNALTAGLAAQTAGSRVGGLASAPELIIDRGAKDFSDAAKEAAQQRRANTSLDINKIAARKRVLNPYLSHRVDEDVPSSSSSSSSLAGNRPPNPYLSSSNASASYEDFRMHASVAARRRDRGFRFV